MALQFDENGIRFQYPENWKVERENSDAGWTVSLQSPDTAFLMISQREAITTEQMVETALEALREDYPDLEADECVDSLAGQPAVGHDIRFFSLDLTNTCWTRCLYSAAGTVLILCQSDDLELEQHEPVLRAMCASLEVDED